MSGIMKEGSLGAILHKSHIITEDDIRAALDEQASSGLRFGEALVSLGIVTQEDIDWALSNQLDIPYVRIKKDMVDPDAVALVPAAIARKYSLFPLVKAGEELSIAIADPLNREAVEAVERVTGCHVGLSMGLIREIREMQEEFYGPVVEGAETLCFSSAAFSAEVIAAINADLTGSTFVDYLILFCRHNRLSSMLLLPSSAGVVITGNRGRAAKKIGVLCLKSYPLVVGRLRTLAGIDSGASVAAGKISYVRGTDKALFRLHLLETGAGDMITIRPDQPVQLPATVSQLAIPEERMARLQEVLAARQGLLLVSGKEGETRDKMLALLLEELARAGRVPLVVGNLPGGFPRVTPGGEEVPAVLADVFAQGVEVVALPSLDDLRTARGARRGVLAGKLVVAGLSAADVGGALREVAALRDNAVLLPEDLAGIVAVGEVRLLCSECRKEVSSTGSDEAEGSTCTSAGCPTCSHTGYAGIDVLLETLTAEQVAAAAKASSSAEAVEILAASGIITLAAQARELVRAGKVAPADVQE